MAQSNSIFDVTYDLVDVLNSLDKAAGDKFTIVTQEGKNGKYAGKKFKYIEMYNRKGICLISFSNKIAEENRTADYIKEHKNELQLGHLPGQDVDSLVLCKKGSGPTFVNALSTEDVL